MCRPATETLANRIVESITAGDLERVKTLIDEAKEIFGPEYNFKEPFYTNYNIMMHACQEAQPDIVQFLIDFGEEDLVNWTLDSMTPLLVACQSKCDHAQVALVVKVLIDADAVINVSNIYGDTPLIYAVQNGHVEVVRMLVDKKASLFPTNNATGNTALFYAVEANSVEMVKILLKAGASFDVPNNKGYLPHVIAANNGFEDVFALFPKIETDDKYFCVPSRYLSTSHYLDMAPGILEKTDVPAYFYRVAGMLQGMELEFLTGKFAEEKICLSDFLTLTQQEIFNMGIELPFHQRKILLNLFKFHERAWSRKSVYRIDKNRKSIDTFDIYSVMAAYLQHLVVMKCSLMFLEKHVQIYGWKPQLVDENVEKLYNNLCELSHELIWFKCVMEFFVMRQKGTTVDTITKDCVSKIGKCVNNARNHLMKVSIVGAIGVAAAIFMKFKR